MSVPDPVPDPAREPGRTSTGAGSLGPGLRLAVGTLTILPVGDIHPLPRGAGRVAMIAAPLAVVPIAAVAGILLWLALMAGAPALVSAALCLATIAVLTRAMHLDGLADTIDGLGGGWTKDRALEIMRSGDVGPMGVAGLVLTLLAQASSLAALTVLPWAGLLAATAICSSRTAATMLCSRRIPTARASGMGAVVARSVPAPAVIGVALIVSAALAGAAAVSGLAWWWGLAAVGGVIVVLGIFLGMVLRKIGGITGDVIGGAIELALTAVLVVLAIGAAA
ncbi:adenosylcobinamide-GDP ribazoletransferase [Blastococcus sp. Marseille-P5729]|uniref:adenosylcobinamide-GDP ribazoletransferase n=1 Tax=Blastococcus sp. Marseille-P5729 TaxID=2086582 RepID=UPI000D0F0127|nr:adenosylcobinamide-GDP ribazoletransferase [Blastococcus sp. Marseille-P5729]